MNEFDKELATNIRATICWLIADGTVWMSLANLRQITPTPRTCRGAPKGINAPWLYAQRFEAIVAANPTFRRFTKNRPTSKPKR